MGHGRTPPPPNCKTTHRTVALSRLAPPRHSGYIALLVSLAILVFFFVLSSRYLADEGPPVLYEGELKLHSTGLFLTLQWGRLWRLRKRNHLLVKLAFERWHMDKEDKAGDEEQAHHHAVRVMRIRKRLRALPLE